MDLRGDDSLSHSISPAVTLDIGEFGIRDKYTSYIGIY